MIRTRAAAIAVGTLLLAACTDAPEEDRPAAAPTSSTSSSATQSPMDDVHDEPQATPFPSTSPLDGRGVADLTLAVMTAYSDHDFDSDPERWFELLAPYLAPQALPAYETVDPRLVPVTQLRGVPVVLDEGAYLASTQQDTDAGVYTVLFSRADDGHWQVERIVPPPVVHDS
jgi:hypothetical protein